jgi:hypothetical protein
MAAYDSRLDMEDDAVDPVALKEAEDIDVSASEAEQLITSDTQEAERMEQEQAAPVNTPVASPAMERSMLDDNRTSVSNRSNNDADSDVAPVDGVDTRTFEREALDQPAAIQPAASLEPADTVPLDMAPEPSEEQEAETAKVEPVRVVNHEEQQADALAAHDTPKAVNDLETRGYPIAYPTDPVVAEAVSDREAEEAAQPQLPKMTSDVIDIGARERPEYAAAKADNSLATSTPPQQVSTESREADSDASKADALSAGVKPAFYNSQAANDEYESPEIEWLEDWQADRIEYGELEPTELLNADKDEAPQTTGSVQSETMESREADSDASMPTLMQQRSEDRLSYNMTAEQSQESESRALERTFREFDTANSAKPSATEERSHGLAETTPQTAMSLNNDMVGSDEFAAPAMSPNASPGLDNPAPTQPVESEPAAMTSGLVTTGDTASDKDVTSAAVTQSLQPKQAQWLSGSADLRINGLPVGTMDLSLRSD